MTLNGWRMNISALLVSKSNLANVCVKYDSDCYIVWCIRYECPLTCAVWNRCLFLLSCLFTDITVCPALTAINHVVRIAWKTSQINYSSTCTFQTADWTTAFQTQPILLGSASKYSNNVFSFLYASNLMCNNVNLTARYGCLGYYYFIFLILCNVI